MVVKRGRKPKMDSKRKAVTHVYWTEEEKKSVEEHARRLGVPLAIYLRTLALGEVAKQAATTGDTKTRAAKN